jgi:hypothetical protein
MLYSKRLSYLLLQIMGIIAADASRSSCLLCSTAYAGFKPESLIGLVALCVVIEGALWVKDKCSCRTVDYSAAYNASLQLLLASVHAHSSH